MDAIEAARRRAASIHANALTRGADPWSPLAFVIAEVEHAGFAAEPIEPNAAQLDGALAKFLPDIGLILYSDTGTSFYRAFLIAHELGHALLGDAAGACQVDIEGKTDAETGSEDRIVAHGPRQRREIQMDLFARELLLPRPFMRRCHLDEDLSGADIANRIGAPPGLVAQQLLDALLIPEISEEAVERSTKLTRSQADAAHHDGEAYLLEAGPGTGKTQTLIARVAHLLGRGVDPRKILILTYSNKAAGELSERIAGDNADAFAAMWIGTFHAFGLDLLRIFGNRIGRSRDPRLLDRAGAIDLLEHELPRFGLKHLKDSYDPVRLIDPILDAISRAQDEMCPSGPYRDLGLAALEKAKKMAAGAARDDAVRLAEEILDIATVYERYEQLKIDKDYVDFGDLILLSVQLLEGDEDARRTAARYSHILVDEYQDVNEASVRLLKILAGSGEGLWAVGDARQSIYRFRGASSRSMARFKHDFPGATGSNLVVNYRSRPEIVSLVSHFGKTMTIKVAKNDPPPPRYEPLGPHHGNCGFKPDLTIVPDGDAFVPAIAERIRQSLTANHRYRDHCLLVSSNDKLARYGAQLESLGLPILFLGSVFERGEVKDLLSLLSLLTDPWAAALVRTACSPEFAMPMPDVQRVIAQLRTENSRTPAWINDPAPIASALTPDGAASLLALSRVLGGLNPFSHPFSILAQLLFDRTRIAARLAARTDPAGKAAAMAVWQFMAFVRTQREHTQSIKDLIARIRRLLALGEDRNIRQLPAAAKGIDAVRLMTIHGAKGLQFHSVHLPGLNKDTMPREPQAIRFPPPEGLIVAARGTAQEEVLASHLEEQDCLFYVALSRAQERLHLYRARRKRGSTKERPQSSFVKRLGALIDRRELSPALSIPRTTAPDVDITLPPSWEIEAWKLDDYMSCPRRFLYRHLIGSGGSAALSPSRAAHSVARTLCAELAALPHLPSSETIDQMIARECMRAGITDMPPGEALQALVARLVGNYAASLAGMTISTPPEVQIFASGTRITARAHDMVSDDGGMVARVIETRALPPDDVVGLATRLLSIRVPKDDPGVRLERISLADGVQGHSVEADASALRQFERAVATRIEAMRQGQFPTKPGAGRCSACPALLICDSVPSGRLIPGG